MTKRLYKLTMTGGGVFYVVDTTETKAREAAEAKWAEWAYIDRKGKVIKIEVLAEEGQYPHVPSHNVLGCDTWLIA